MRTKVPLMFQVTAGFGFPSASQMRTLWLLSSLCCLDKLVITGAPERQEKTYTAETEFIGKSTLWMG